MTRILSICIGLLLWGGAQAQTTPSIKGQLKDSSLNLRLKAATVSLLDAGDSSLISFALSDEEGQFQFFNTAPGSYLVQLSYSGYEERFVRLRLAADPVNLGSLYLNARVRELDAVVVQSSPVVIKGDTVEYNAGSFKTKPNAVVEDVLKKLPGVTVDREGNITANGKPVQRVLVDGKRFFGDDPKLATRNLPSEVIDKIQVYEAQTDQAAFTGFDDGDRMPTINITTKKDKRKGYFGKGTVGAGTKERYEGSLSFNRFNGNEQLSLIGQANNVNRQGFSLQDLLGVMNMSGGTGGRGAGFGGGGAGRIGQNIVGALVGGASNNGINTIATGGLNYRNKFSKNTEGYGSYFFNRTRLDRQQTSLTENLLSGDTSLLSNNVNNSRNINQQHRLNYTFETIFDSSTSMIIRPSISYQNSDVESFTTGTTRRGEGGKLLNSNTVQSRSDGDGFNGNADITLRHKFKKKGRTISLNTVVGGSTNFRRGYTYSIINQTTPSGAARTDTLDQQQVTDVWGRNSSATLSYTEPIARNQQIELAYNYGHNFNNSDRQVLEPGKTTGLYDQRNAGLSNHFENTNFSHRGTVSYRLQHKKYNGSIGTGLQWATLNSYNVTRDSTLRQRFVNVFPTANFTYNFTKSKNLRINYRGRTNQPGINQLQPVVNNANPLYIQTGNPGLKQEFVNTAGINYTQFNMFTFRNIFASLNFSQTSNKIVNSTVYTPFGGQVVRPENASGTYGLNGFFTAGFPVKKLKGNLSFSTNASWNQNVSLVNQVKNYTRNAVLAQTIGFNTTLSTQLDLNFTTTTTYNIARYTLQPDQNVNSYSQLLGLDLQYTTKSGWLTTSDFDYTYFGGRNQGYNTSVPLWNLGLGRQLFKKKEAELKITLYDVLNQNKSIVRNVTDNTVQDVRTNVITRYFMLTFTYNLRKFAGASMPMPGFINNNFRRMQRNGGMMMGM